MYKTNSFNSETFFVIKKSMQMNEFNGFQKAVENTYYVTIDSLQCIFMS